MKMHDIIRVFCIVCACLVFRLISCGNDTYLGRQAPSCDTQYWQILRNQRASPRTYLYYHEAMTLEQRTGGEEEAPDEDGPDDLQMRVVGGDQVSIEEVPYQVLYGMYCGGTIIAPQWVITAAHCKDKESFVLAGSTRRSLGTKYNICAHFNHPLWETRSLHAFDFDYQLILLEQPIPVTPSSMPIAIGNVGDLKEGELVSVSGWGHTKFQELDMQEILRRVYVPIMSQQTCQSLSHKDYKTVTPRMFCAGYLSGSKGPCHGDSGGPVVSNGKLLGLVSFGVGCAMEEKPGVFGNIPLVRDWIRDVTGLPL